jgi:transposase
MDIKTLPDDIDALKEIIVDYNGQITILQEKLNYLLKTIYGQKSEKRKSNTIISSPNLLDFAGLSLPSKKEEPPVEIETVTVPEHKRKKRGRKPIPEDIPREDVFHDLDEHEKICLCGCTLSPIGKEVSEKLDYVPARLIVERHIRLKYACRGCEGVESEQGAVKIAPMPPQLIPQGIVTPGLLAYIITAKFVDGLPFYRQEKQFKRLGIDLSRSTMTSWAMSVARACEPLRGLLKQEILTNHIIGMDETTVQVMNEPGRPNTSQSYMWVFFGYDPLHQAVLYCYHATRNGQALEFLKDHKGYIQSDGYSGYNELGRSADITHVGCLAHIRRKFMDVVKLSKRDKNKGGTAQTIVDLIGQLYLLERSFEVQKLKPDRIKEERQNNSVPILNQIKSILDQRKGTSPPGSKLGTAINYTLNQWERMICYVQDGRLRPDNNLVENAIRPFAVGRKNWLFHGSPNGAEAGALFYSLIETAKLNGLEPYAYLRYLFENLPLAKTQDDVKELMPQYVDKSIIPVYTIPDR